VAEELNLQVNQLLPMFNKAIRKFANMCKASYESEISAQLMKEEIEAKEAAKATMNQHKT